MKDSIRILFWSSRPVSWINTAYPFAAGYLMLTKSFDATLLIGTLFFLVPYNLLMYGVNDVYDYESDIRNPRKGGVEGAVVSKAHHKLVLSAAFSLALPFVLYLLYVSPSLTSQVTLLIVVALVLTYSMPPFRLKERPVLDSINSSCHFIGPLVYALTFVEFDPMYIAIVASFFLWGMASHAFGAIQDIVPDRAGGIHSIATVFGAARTARLSIALYAAAGLLLLPFGWPGWIVAATSIGYVIAVWPYRAIADNDAEQTNVGWRMFMRLNALSGFIITLVLMYIYKIII
jgi:4-hydroxybenzoate polyprenyltransferase